MRYIGRDDTHVYIKCRKCKKIHAYNREHYEEHFEKKCAECGAKCRFVWLYPIKLSRVKLYMPILVMTILFLFCLLIINIPFFMNYYFFNKAVTALNPIVASILIPILCSLITIIPMKWSDNSQKGIVERIKGNGVQIIGILIEFVVLIISLNIVIGIKYCSLQIRIPDTDETMQYFGNAIEKSASGKGRLFDAEGHLVYKGEFKNNLYDGYGKKFEKITNVHDTDISGTYQCVYDGYFKEGMPNGRGCEYRYDEEYDFEKGEGLSIYLHYEGEFENGEYCGIGTLYGIKTKYEGVFFDGEYNGYGSLWKKAPDSEQTLKFVGVYTDGKLNGSGKKYRADGSVSFDGEYKDGSGVSGTTFYENGNPRYKGEWKEGNYNGEGIQYWESGEKRYDGSWNNGKRDGYGTSYREDGTLEYIGNWKEDQYDSNYGKLYYEDGETIYYEGGFSSGKRNGDGTSYRQDGKKEYQGNWKSGNWDGKGTWHWENGKKYYVGDFVDGQPDGNGISYRAEGIEKIRYDGEWSKGKYSGQGKLYDENGKIEHIGEFVDGEYIEDSGDKQ